MIRTFIGQTTALPTYGGNGGTNVPEGTDIQAAATEILHLLQAGIGTIEAYATVTVPYGRLKCNGAAISRTTYAALFAKLARSSSATITVATPGVVTWTAHGLLANDPVIFRTSGTLPTGITAGTVYYVKTVLSANTYTISATAGGSAINTTGSAGTGHTGWYAPFGDGDGSTTFNVPDMRGEFMRGWADNASVDTGRTFGSAQGYATETPVNTNSSPILRGIFTSTGYTNNFSTDGTDAIWGIQEQVPFGSFGDGVTTAVSRGTQTWASETRPRNKAMMFCIRY